MAQPHLLLSLPRPGRLEQNVRPLAELKRVPGGSRAQPGVLRAEGDQWVLLALRIRQQAVDQALADAEHRKVDAARLQLLEQPLQHQGAVGQYLPARARDI